MKAITHISCIGAGLIGQGWATQFCSGGYDLKTDFGSLCQAIFYSPQY